MYSIASVTSMKNRFAMSGKASAMIFPETGDGGGGSSAASTRVPTPVELIRAPDSTSDNSAFRTVGRETPNSDASARSGARNAPAP